MNSSDGDACTYTWRLLHQWILESCDYGLCWKARVAFGIVYVWRLLCERVYCRCAIELIHESSLKFGGSPRLLAGHAAQDQS